jgi:hypothetical protein
VNAYELAEKIESMADAAEVQTSEAHAKWHRDIADMLRQQADRIAELEKVIQLNNEVLKPMLIDCIKRNLSVIDANLFFAKYDSVRGTKERITPQTKPLSEPVAWIRNGDDQLSLVKEKDDGYMVWKPLYLAPQTKPHPKCDEACMYLCTAKPLSDEEICKLFNEHTGLGVNQKEALQADLIVFARAIEERHGIK